MTDKQLAEFFVEQRVLQPAQAEDVLSEVELNGKTVAQAMIDGGFTDEPGFYQTIADGLGTDFIDLTEREIAPSIRSICMLQRISASRLAKTFKQWFRRPSKSRN